MVVKRSACSACTRAASACTRAASVSCALRVSISFRSSGESWGGLAWGGLGWVVRGGIEDLRGVASGNGWLAARVQVQVSAQGRGAQQRGDARAAGGVEARALEIAGRGARARGGALRQEERLVPRMGEAAGGAGRGAECAAVRGRRAPAGAGGEARALGDRGGDARARARGGALRVDKRAQAAEACLPSGARGKVCGSTTSQDGAPTNPHVTIFSRLDII
jgi:hypothetical protein